MKPAVQLVLSLFLLVFGVYLYRNVLPYYLSPQKDLDYDTLTGVYDSRDEQGVFLGQTVYSQQLSPNAYLAQVLGETTASKRIEVDLTNQHLYAYEGDIKVFDFLISSGKYGATPTGKFRIWIKLKYTKMEGGNRALGTYYYLPNVPFVMYFASSEVPPWKGYGLHGAYWHNNFGHPMSHGCINIRPEDAEKLFYWANPTLNGKSSIKATDENPGTEVIIYGEAPWE